MRRHWSASHQPTGGCCRILRGKYGGLQQGQGYCKVLRSCVFPWRCLREAAISCHQARLYEFLNVLSDQPVPKSRARAVHSSGGAAGGVVSESQGYGLLLTGALLASMEVNDSESLGGILSDLD